MSVSIQAILNSNANLDIINVWINKANENAEDPSFSFIASWIAFNALYYPTTLVESDDLSLKEFVIKDIVQEKWAELCLDDDFIRSLEIFLALLKTRSIYGGDGLIKGTGGILNMKTGKIFDGWNFENSPGTIPGFDLDRYISLIYQIRCNLFHGGKGSESYDIDLLNKSLDTFRLFLNKLMISGIF